MPKAKRNVKNTRKSPMVAKPSEDPLFPARERNPRIGGAIRPTTDLSRFVKWPRNVKLQRRKKLLTTRLKIPPAINQFTRTLSKDQAKEMFMLLTKYKPEDKHAKKERLRAAAQAKVDGKKVEEAKKPCYVQYGIQHVTSLIETKKAKMVCVASDVDPLELVMWMPALCRKMDVPYCIVKNKARLGALVGKKTATCVAVTRVNKADQSKLDKLSELCMSSYNNNKEAMRTWGGGKMGLKTVRRLAIRQKFLDAEAEKKAMY